MKRGTKLHFVGIGGIGMSGIAEVLFNQGYLISGSDLSESETTKRLSKLGLAIHLGHRAEHVRDTEVVIISSAVKPSNPEVMEAKRLRIPVIPRAEMLGELMRGKTGIAIAGTHGKTTTTSMLATILTHGGYDPTLVIGGKVDSLGGNAKLGLGPWVVAEADESDGSFLHLPATYGVITNIDNDHLDYFGSIEAIEDAFVGFVAKIPFYGAVAVCGDDPGVTRCLDRFTKPIITYGLSERSDVYAYNIDVRGAGSQFLVRARTKPGEKHLELGSFTLKVPGTHNVLNALASIALSTRVGVDPKVISTALTEFHGVKRRFDICWRRPETEQVIVDDYAHHPTEILATLSAAKNFWPGRIIAVFQPHRFTRTLHCLPGFLGAFLNADVLLISDIYPAGEEPIEGVNSPALVQALQKKYPNKLIQYAGDLDSTAQLVKSEFRNGDMVIYLGAGSITRLPEKLIPS